MTRALIFALALSLAAYGVAARADASEREVTIDLAPAALHGALRTPEGPKRDVGVLVLPGSGPTDRNGDAPAALRVTPDTLKLLADGLEQAGYASLRIDKRCVGESVLACPGEPNLTIDVYVDDAVSWVKFLRAQPGIRCVVVLGHSEGALIGALAGAKTPLCGLISAAGPGRGMREVIEDQVAASGAGAQVLARVKDIDAHLAQGKHVDAVEPALYGLFRPSVQSYVISEMRVSPTAAIAAQPAPVLVLQGDDDIQVRVDDARLLAGAHRGARLAILDGVNHVLKTAPADRAANIAAYADPTLPLAPGVMGAILDFLSASTGQSAAPH